MRGKKKYFVNVMAQGLSRSASVVSTFLVYILVARLGGVELFGQYSYILAFLGLFVIVAEFGTSSSLMKDMVRVKLSAGIYWGNFLILRMIFACIVIILSTGIAYFLRRDIFPCLMLGVAALPFLTSRFFEPLFQIYDRPWFSLYPSLVYGLSYILFTLAAIPLLKELFPVVAAYVIANILYLAVAFPLSLRLLKPVFKIHKLVMMKILAVSLPFGVSSFFAIINSRVAIFMLAKMKSDYDVGIYNAGYRFLDIAVMLAVTMTAPMVPIFAKQAVAHKEMLTRNYERLLEIVGTVLAPLAIIVPLVSGSVVTLFFGEAFFPATAVINAFAWLGILVFCSLLTTGVALSLGIVRYAYWNTAVAAAFNIALNLFLIPKYSYVASAWIMVVCEVFIFAVGLFFVMRKIGNVFNVVMWVKIIFLNTVVAGILVISIGLSIIARLSACLLVYTAAVYLFGLIKKEDFALLMRMERE